MKPEVSLKAEDGVTVDASLETVAAPHVVEAVDSGFEEGDAVFERL